MRHIALGIFGVSLFFGVFNPKLALAKKPPERPGRWAVSFNALGDIPVNERLRDHYKSGLGLGSRIGYGFWEGLSLEMDLHYNLLFKEGGSNKAKENKNLFSFAPGLRYTHDFLPDFSWNIFGHVGGTADYTEKVNSSVSLSYMVGTGFDFAITENLNIGPLFQFRHVLQDEQDDDDMKIQVVSVGVAVSYLYD